ncbi:hypothetical protein JMJ77_0012161 [Colletotrichum scovillei]|uniref:Uncharacterized protein n=1 Tax=Colletotrichum scovillei TaxID=1209932 RepID=A0A9P7QUC9_9PEZI|nr:hypothetical protein JMJ78_0001214 [Colletotrichum scovillei]KAG7041641.1 hypothetical protein JMJ77_0012161 [Colletotrichum scovillei]KAG7061668.1 hypothetical protein JMJ76_0003628 [Colletotrichum scovillei]
MLPFQTLGLNYTLKVTIRVMPAAARLSPLPLC